MALIRNLNDDPYRTYIPTIAFFCGIMCTIMMFKFRGFKASFNLLSGKNQHEKTTDAPVLGAYRCNTEDYVGYNNHNYTPKSITPSMTKLPKTSHPTREIIPSKSTGDLSKLNEKQPNSRKSTSDLPSSSSDQRKEIKNKDKEQRKSEKQRQAEQKKSARSAREQEKEKVKRDRDNHEAQKKHIQGIRPKKQEKKAPAPKPPTNTSQGPVKYSSNTLESSISRSSGPPPYTSEVVPNQYDNTGNTSFSKPVDSTSSWELVSQHRQQLNRTVMASNTKPKNTVLDLHYNGGNTRTTVKVKGNSEA